VVVVHVFLFGNILFGNDDRFLVEIQDINIYIIYVIILYMSNKVIFLRLDDVMNPITIKHNSHLTIYNLKDIIHKRTGKWYNICIDSPNCTNIVGESPSKQLYNTFADLGIKSNNEYTLIPTNKHGGPRPVTIRNEKKTCFY